MAYRKLCLLLLLSSYTVAQRSTDNSEQTSACLLGSKFKVHRKYVYQYTTESRNGVVGTANLRNGPKVTCQVEIEVPQMCRFILHTRHCALSEVSVMDPQGQPVYGPAPGSDAFKASMEKNPLKFSVEDETHVQLYPETDETVNILNIKRGIVSALLVPLMENGQSGLVSTVHGRCSTTYVVNTQQDIATDVTLSRDLSQCDQFYGRELTNSRLALLQKLHNPLSKLITSTQSCNYLFDNKGKHITSAMCTERHVYLPFSHRENGISSVVTQELSFQSVTRHSNRVFDVDQDQAKFLHFEEPDDKAPVQTKDAVLSTFQELVALTGTDQGQKRTGLFYKLVSGMRVLRNETLSQTVADMADVSPWLTFQALIQCGTPECTSAIMQVIWTTDGVSLEVDALVYGLSLQADPDAAQVRDMLSMAQYRQSKAIMYALANTVKKFHKGEVTPVVTDVSKFMEMLLNDCSEDIQDTESDFPPDPKEVSFLVLRVVGVMGQAMQDVSPGLISAVLQCAKKTDIALSNQKAAIQALRLMDINDEIRAALMEVYQDPQSPVEKRLAAYLVTMKNPDQTLLREVLTSLMKEKDEQLRSFVISHLNNIRNSDEPQMLQLREDIEMALQGSLSPTDSVFEGLSRNYKISSPLGSLQSNIILDGKDTLPKEMMLEATLKAFDYNYDLFEVGVEGRGFQPTIDSLFGEKGFFPESISRLVYLAVDSAPVLKDVLDKISPRQDRMKRQVSEDHLKAITEGFQKLVNNVRFSPTPEATVYLRLLGDEIGYLKTSEMRKMFETLFMYYHVYIRVLPAQAFLKLTSSTENEFFFHYIFMENAFSLPTAAGFPLKFSLSGLFAPGAKGGFTPSSMTDLSFMPSVGLEFITQMGVHIPDYVDAGIEMHTNMYHQSSINAKLSVNRNQVKLSVPAPKSNFQLFSISNKLLSVSAGQTKIVPSLVEDRVDSTDCQPLFSGLNLCTKVRYSNATSVDRAPYYPLSGETTFAVEIQPTGKVSEYTATITDETLREGKKGRNRVESLKLTLRAEGEESVEASASLKYNHNKNLISADVVVPGYDVEAGVKLAVTDGDYEGKKMRGITIDVTNKNIPQLTLVGRVRLDQMKEAMLQLQMEIPSLKTDASVTAVLKRDEDMLLDFETVVRIPESSYQQSASLKYDDDKFEVELKTGLNSDIQKLIPSAEEHHRQLQKLIDDILDQKVAKTDMKLRHIVSKGIVAGNIWLDKLTERFPSLANLRSKRSLSDLTLPALPEKLFLHSDSLLRYQFNKDKIIISLPLPLGGKNSEEMNIPMSLSLPAINLPQIGLNIPANKYSLPSFTVPPTLDFTVPLLGLAEASTKIQSNLYSWEGSILGGNDTADVPSYVVQYKAAAQSPLNLLSYKLEGIGMISGRPDDNLKYLLNSSFSHSLIDTSFSVLETLRVSNKLNARANYRFEASSPLGLQASLYYSAQSTSTPDSDEVSGDGTVDGLLKFGSFYTNTSYTHSYNLRPLDREGRGESTMHFDSPFIQFHNMIQGAYANSELTVISKTTAMRDIFKHVAELKYKDAQLTLKCNAVGTVMGKSLNNKVELGVSSHMSILRIESQADDDTNRIYSLITGSLDSNRLEVNSEGSLTFDAGRALHKATVRAGRDGLTFGGTNNIQCSPVTMENIFNGAIDINGASLSSTTKAMAEESRGQLNIEGKITASEASLNGELKGHSYDATTTNNMNIVLNRRALTFNGNTKGTLREIKTESSHTLILTLWTFDLNSNTDNFICDDIYYKQHTKVNMKPFVMALDMTNDLKLYDLSMNNEGYLKLEPVKADLSGSVMGAYGDKHIIRHFYGLTYNEMAGSVKYSTSGTVMDAQLSHNCELKFAGLSSISKCEARINSEPLRFDGSIRTMALPFSLNIDALVSGDGKVNLLGKHTGQLDSKLLVKAAPLALACSHECRVSTTHTLPSGESSTSLENKFDGLLTPKDQSLDWKVNSKMNNHGYEQGMSAYNSPEKAGIAFSGVMQTDVVSRYKRSTPETEKFSVAGFLKYDKNSNCHIIEIPFIESIPVAFEQLKSTLVQALESVQQFIHNLNVNQLIKDFRDNIDQVPIHVRNFMQMMDLENKVNQVKDKLDYFIAEFAVTMEDFELAMENLRQNVEATIMDIVTKVRDLISTVEEHIKAGHLADKVTNVLTYIGAQLQAFEEKYKIKQSFVRVLIVLEDIIRQIDLQKLKESSVAFLQELDSKYGIMETIKEKLSELKQVIQDLSLNQLLEDVKNYLLSFDWASYIEQLSYQIPASEIAKVLESMKDVIVNWIDEYEIPQKMNAVIDYLKAFILKHELEIISKDLMDQAVTLVKEFKIEETVQSVVDALKSIKFEFVYDKIINFLHTVTNQLQAIDFKKSIGDINERISSTLELMKDFDYNAFVDETNVKIAELTKYINDEIEKYEIVQKIEALREFFREIQNSIFKYLDELKNTKVADALKKLKEVIDTAFYNDIKLKMQDILEDMRQRILDMDIRNEIYIHLQRISESYSNIVAYISAQFSQLMEKISDIANNNEIINQIKQAVNGVLDELQRAEIEFPAFTVPLTDLEIPAFTINLNKLKDIQIPAQISVPEFTILDSYTIPAFTIDFEELKAKIVAIIDDIKAFQIQTPDPVEIFGDLKVLYLFKLPDLTLPEITLLEIKFPAISIPKLNMRDFIIRVLSIPDVTLPEIPSDVCIPAFGKLHGEFTITSPQYTLVTTGKIENSTSTLKNPQFTATIASRAKSPFEPLEFTFEANAQLEAPKMKKLLFKETVKATHVAFTINHEGSLTFTGSSVAASAKTTAKATTQMYTADLTSNMALSLQNAIHSTIATSYSHNLDIPSMETSSQVSIKHNIAASKESGKITVNSQTNSNGKWSVKDYSDEGTHKSNIEFTVDSSTAKLTFEGDTGCKALKMKQTLTAESVILSHIIVDAKCETETPSIKKSIMILNGEAHIGDLKAVLTASHSAEFTESLTGSVSNSLEFKAHPFEMILDVKNKVNSKLFFPLKLTGKVDLQYDYGVVLNSEKQRAFWVGSARFNQYKYSHNITAENSEMNILFHSSVSGEANLDFLTIPLSIPEMTIPHLEMKTPEVTDFSLWEHTGLKSLLITPQQSFDMNLKLQYSKNPDMHSFELHLEPIYNAISDNARIIQIQFEVYRDKVVAFLKDSYNEAKSQYIKHKIDTSSLPPRIFRVPGYTIPVLNIQVSRFSAEMPAFTYFVPKEVSTPSFKVPALGFSVPSYTLVLPSLRLPVLHVPDTLSEIRLPAFTLPAVQDNIVIPAMGNITCDFSFKSTVITLSANAGFYNESDIVARFGASSVSVFDALNGKIDGTTSLTRTRGLKLATIVSLEHKYIEANHECAVSLNKRSLEASTANSAKIDLPFLKLEFSQELTGNTKTKPNVSSKKKLKYMFNIPLIESVGKGNLDINWELETLLSHVSLEMSTEGKSDITIMDNNFVGDLLNRANFYLNANSLRSTARTTLKVNMDEQEKQKRSSDNNLFDLYNNLALEVSLRRVFATFDYTSSNSVDLASLETNGKHFCKGELDFVPLTAFRTTLVTEASQMSGLGNAEIVHSINLDIGYEKQTFSWTGQEQLGSFTQACDLSVSNNESEIRMDLAGSVAGHLAFLKSIRLPVYQRSLWDVLKFDEVTSIDNLQSFKISSSVVYTKSMDGYDYTIPIRLFKNGITFSIPEMSIAMPSWVKEIPQTIKNIDKRFENVDVPDHLTLPPKISVPAFEVPFTNLHVESFTVDPKKLFIPEVITTKAFDIMLPGIPVISVPSYDITTMLLHGKMLFLLFKIPQYEITMSSFMLPTSFTIGEYTISLNEITNQISNFQFPNIIIPKQKIEIPETALYLPSSVFIPTFGALSATLNVSTPIYNVSTSTNMEQKNSNLITSLYSICTSTMIFLEYELTAKATLGYDNEVVNLNGNCKLAHSDVNVFWNHTLIRSWRTKRQVSRGDLTKQESHHTLNIDVTSQSFADVSFRFASRKDGVTASMLSPSAGYLGLHLQRKSPSQLVGKLFSRYLSTPDKDTNVFTAKASLRNSEKLVLQTSWNWGFFNDLTEGIKSKIPAMTNAVLVCINKYHTAHFGFDLNRGSMKLKSSVSNIIERAGHEVSVSFTALRDVVQILARQGKDMYSKASDVLMSTNVQDLTDMVVHQLKQVITYTHNRIKVLVDAVTQIFSGRKFTVPGSDRKLTIMEMFQRAQRSISKATDRAIQRFFTIMGKISAFIRNTEFTIPGTDVVVDGDEIMDKLQSFLESAYGKIQVSMREGVSSLYKAANSVYQMIAEKAEELLTYLKDKNSEMTPKVDGVYAEVMQSSRQHSEEAKRRVAEYKDLVKLKIHQVYNSVNVELVNSRTKEFISILQSNLSEAFTDVDLMKWAPQSTAPYVRVSNAKVDVEIPLPFLWKSFSEWPTQFRQ